MAGDDNGPAAIKRRQLVDERLQSTRSGGGGHGDSLVSGRVIFGRAPGAS